MSDNENLGTVNDQQSNVSEDVMSTNTQNQSNFNIDDYVPKKRVEEIIHSRTREVAQKTAEKVRAEFEQQQTHQQNHKQGMGLGGMSQLGPDEIKSMISDGLRHELQSIRESSEKEMRQQRITELTNDYLGKLQAHEPELLKREQEIAEMYSLIPLINESSEAAAITKHLLDNDSAYANLMVLSHTAPARVRNAIKKIEALIKENKEALSRSYPNEPLSQPRPSVITADAGSNSIEALKKDPFLRG